MTDRNRDQEALARLNRVLVEDILAASDESMLAEVTEEGSDPAAIVTATRDLFERTALASGKTHLAAAKDAVAADSRRRAAVLSFDAAAARRHLERLLKRHPETAQKLTLAARKEPSEIFPTTRLGGSLRILRISAFPCPKTMTRAVSNDTRADARYAGRDHPQAPRHHRPR